MLPVLREIFAENVYFVPRHVAYVSCMATSLVCLYDCIHCFSKQEDKRIYGSLKELYKIGVGALFVSHNGPHAGGIAYKGDVSSGGPIPCGALRFSFSDRPGAYDRCYFKKNSRSLLR